MRERTVIRTDDDMDGTPVPFIQANSMERIISLLENLYGNPLTPGQIADLMDFDPRQSDYYYNAGRYLGLFEKENVGGQVLVRLTGLGEKVFRMNYKPRQLKLVELMLEHRIFAEFFDMGAKTGRYPDKKVIGWRMRELHVCSEGQIARRASSVERWLEWIFHLTRL